MRERECEREREKSEEAKLFCRVEKSRSQKLG